MNKDYRKLVAYRSALIEQYADTRKRKKRGARRISETLVQVTTSLLTAENRAK